MNFLSRMWSCKTHPIIPTCCDCFCLVLSFRSCSHLIRSMYILSDKTDILVKGRARWPATQDFSLGGSKGINRLFCSRNILHPGRSYTRKPFKSWYDRGACLLITSQGKVLSNYVPLFFEHPLSAWSLFLFYSSRLLHSIANHLALFPLVLLSPYEEAFFLLKWSCFRFLS